MEPVKAKRRYDSSRRRAQAEATRGDILEAARRRFEDVAAGDLRLGPAARGVVAALGLDGLHDLSSLT